jgi:copper resistance protein B
MRAALALPLALAAPAAAERLPYVLEEEEPAQLPYHVPAEDAAETASAGPRLHYGLFDRLEYAAQRGTDGYAWDLSALWGGERDRLWLAAVGEGPAWSDPDYLELQALYGRAVGGGWDLNAGLRYDAVPAPHRVYLVTGGQLERETRRGDYWLGAFAYLSQRGELSARLTGIYNHAVTKRLIVQPAFELNATAEDVPALGLGRGLSYAEAGLRLRYEIAEAFAPYLGLSWERAFGRTARMTREAGEDPDAKSLVLGLRSSF